MTTKITSLTLGRMEYCRVFNHGKGKNFDGNGAIEATLVELAVHLSIWVRGSTQDGSVTVVVDLDKQELTAMIGQLQAMKAVLVERLEDRYGA